MRALRFITVTLGALVLTTLSINAFDNIGNPQNSLLGAAFGAFEIREGCPEEMVEILVGERELCVDVYEASAGDGCLYTEPKTKGETDDNLLTPGCKPVSGKGRTPWTNISRHQAELACVRVDKRLPRGEEWYRAALGTPDKNSGWSQGDCNVNAPRAHTAEPSGEREGCVSAHGVYDMIGNVWEWQEETTLGAFLGDLELPDEGFVSGIDSKGNPAQTSPGPDAAFFNDYMWARKEGVRGVVRGGYWKSGADAGQYAFNASSEPSLASVGVGFRCVKDL